MSAEGTVTVMFTDVVASSRLATDRGDRVARELVAVHEDAVRRRAAEHGGQIVKGTGDGLLLSFPSARRAVLCALDVQDTLALHAKVSPSEAVLVRIGLHAGDVLSQGGDLYGSTVNAASRIMDRAAGGQVVVSEVVRQLAGSDPGITFTERRPVKLKGLDGRWRLYDVRRDVPETDTSAPRLWGRDAELTALRDVLDRGRRGSGGVALVEGEGGIGKSRLMAELATEARQLGFDVFVGGAEELERATALSGVAHALARLPGFSRGDDATVEQILDLLEAHALRTPTFVCIEDLHWADTATIQFVRAAARRAEGLPLALFATLRPQTGPAELAHLVERLSAEGVLVLRIGPLDDGSIAGLMRDAIGSEAGPHLRRQVEGAAGSPLYVLELVSALLEEGAIVASDGAADVREQALPPSLRVVILRRLASLPPEVFEDLRTCSMLGSSFATDDLAIATKRSAIDLLRALAPALSAGFLHDTGGRLAFRHDLVRAALYEDVPLALRRAIHKEIGAAFAAAGRPSASVATHMGLGAEVGDFNAVDWLFRAGIDVGMHSLELSLEMLERAIELCPEGHPKRTEILAGLVIPLAFTWRGAEAAELGERLLRAGVADELEPMLRHGLAHAYQRLGRNADAIEQWERMRRLPLVQEGRRRSLAGDIAWMWFVDGDPVRASELAREAIDDATGEPNDFALCMGNFVLAFVASARGDVSAALEHGLEAAHWATVIWEDRAAVPTAPLGAAVALVDADRWDEGLEHLHRGHRRSEDSGISNAIQYDQTLTLIRYQLGEWDDVLAHAQATLALTDEFLAGTQVAFGTAARVHVHRGDLSDAEDVVRRGEEILAAGGNPLGAELLLWVSALLQEAGGDLDAAVATLTTAWELGANYRYFLGSWRAMLPDVVRIARAADREDLVIEAVAAAATGAERASGIGSVDAMARRIAALATGDGDALLAAAESLTGTGRVVEQANALTEAGTLLARAGDPRGREVLVGARAMFAEFGALRDVDRIQALLRELGMRPGRTGARQRPTMGWDALTPSELRVVALVAEGLTNAQIGDRLFVSRRTVQTHMRSVFAKLDASSRAEVAATFARRS